MALRFGTSRTGVENDAMAAKLAFMKENRPRAALGDIGNHAAKLGDVGRRKVGDVKLVKKPLTRTKASSSLQTAALVKESQKHHVAKPAATNLLEPMDMEEISEALDECFGKKIVDIDAEDHENPQMCAEYVNEIYRYMRNLERKFSIPADYMDNQVEINDKMRSILVDWLIQVHLRFRLLQETLYMTVSIIDRFLAVHDVPKSKLQLVGVSAMLLASKYEEMYAPEIQDFVIITDNAYTKAQIRKMEALIFQTLGYNLGKPVCLHFLRRNSKAGGVDPKKHTLAKYFMELCLIDYQSIKFLPSEIAAAALCLSIKAIDDSEWSETLEHYSTYSEESLRPCMQRMAQLVTITTDERCKWNAIPKKYASSKFMTVSALQCSQPSNLERLVDRVNFEPLTN